MLETDWYLLTSITSLLKVVTWCLPLVLLTALAHYIQKYTRFKTRVGFLSAATFLALLYAVVIAYDYRTMERLVPTHELLANTILITGMTLGTYASVKLLKFQNISIGKTRDVVEIIATTGLVIPSLAYMGGRISFLECVNLVEHNTCVALLVLVYLVIGKIIRNYVPRHGRLAYAIVVLASILLPVNILSKNYAYISLATNAYKNAVVIGGLAVQSGANILLGLAALLLIREARIRGIHLTPSEAEKTDKTPLRYRLKDGFSYMIYGADGKKAFEVFNEYIRHRNNGLGVIRTRPDLVREEYQLRTTPLLWMTTVETEEKSIRPTDLERLLFIIKDFIGNDGRILLIEKLDYLISENGFKRTLNFVHRLNDMVSSSDCILLASINMDTLATEQRIQLMEDFKDLTESDSIVLNETLYEVLEYVYQENKSGRRPSFKKITDKFRITKTTTRKRVYDLQAKKMLNIIDDGKFKLLEVTEAGVKLMKNPVGPRGW